MKLSKRICKRVLSLFLAVALAVSAVAYRPPKAEAIAVVDDIAVVVAVFVAACGLTWIVKNQSGGDFTAAVQQLVTTYAGSLGETYAEWCARVSYSLSAGHLIFGKGVVSVLSDFAHDDTLQQILDAIIANNLAVTQDVVTPSDTDLTWTDTLWGWLTGIKDAIIGLPARIADAVKALFIPDEAFFDTAVADLQTTFQGRMGLLTYPMSVLYNFTDRVMNIQDQEPILRWDTVNFMDHQLIPAGQYNLNDGLQTPALKTAHDIYFIVVNAVMILAFLDLCWKKYREVTHN